MTRALTRLRARLADIQTSSRHLPWADESPDGIPWKVSERIRSEPYGGARAASIVVLDLHHLDVPLALAACDVAVEVMAETSAGLETLRLIVGMGHGSEGGRKLAPAVFAHVDGARGMALTSHTRGAPDGYLDLYDPRRIEASALPDPTPHSPREPADAPPVVGPRQRAPTRLWVEVFRWIGRHFFGSRGARIGALIGEWLAQRSRRR